MKDGDDLRIAVTEIRQRQPDPRLMAQIDKTVNEACYTTTVLLGIAEWLEDNEDPDGASMLRDFAEEFILHEADGL